MALAIEDYAMIGDLQTAGLVGRDGSLDWLCLPRFDSPAPFAALLGNDGHGHWRLAPAGRIERMERRYRPDTLVLETDFHTAEGVVTLVDCMPPRGQAPDVIRLVRGVSGRVPMRMKLVMRFDYGHVTPWVRRQDGRLLAVAGPDALTLTADVPFRGENFATVAEFEVSAGEEVGFHLVWHPSHLPAPEPLNVAAEIAATERWWLKWAESCTYDGPWADQVRRSLITLKGLTFGPTGGIVAAPTTSLPEKLGGVRNWDYRYVWVRDATLALLALLDAGYQSEAAAWRDWLLRAVAGSPSEMQIMYGPAGERRLTELTLDWLPGYERSSPVRVGNAASSQFQLDVYGELMDALHQARAAGVEPEPAAWRVQRALMDFLETAWGAPDEGIWEMRGPRRHFVHSKVMAWVAFDRAIRGAERWGLEGPVDSWRRTREQIHREVCERGWDSERSTFTQSYDSQALDASLLMIPQYGFLPPSDPRVHGTIDAIQRELCVDGFVLRYPTDVAEDGLPPGEGAFLPCTFWLADALSLTGRRDEAVALFERLLALTNDVGLLSEEYDTITERQVGNFPQAFSHIGLVNTAMNLAQGQPTPARERAGEARPRSKEATLP
ncbi:MAG: Glucoamylase [uncultured Solirubrobacteraceae bacterium]|uniref:Trehalase n=1 Tax=uncultured Solirubrobacteraceae bacterium TaxID=1162706 RepID=A0A6J4RXY0_9ACTN|nr:MAG: Glucoamylase [uncultured Solirubrobacteraceae bacterium]